MEFGEQKRHRECETAVVLLEGGPFETPWVRIFQPFGCRGLPALLAAAICLLGGFKAEYLNPKALGFWLSCGLHSVYIYIYIYTTNL